MKKNIEDVSACIVTYNNDPEMVIQAIDSFLKTGLNVSMTVADNDSTNGIMAALLKKYKNKKNVQIISTGKNGGYGFGHNFGLKNSMPARYHLVMNPDVVIHKGTLAKMFQFMEKNRDIGLLSPKILNPDGTIQKLNKRNPTVFNLFSRRFLPKYIQKLNFIKKYMDSYIMEDVGYDNMTDVPYLSGSFMFFRYSLIEKMKVFFDESYFMHLEDADITRRVAGISRAVYFPEVSITHLWNRESHRRISHTLILIKSMLVYFKKWGWKIF